MSSSKVSNCPHVSYVDSVTWEELHSKHEKDLTCNTCNVKGKNLWLCLVGACQYVGCGESVKDHSSVHATEKKHSMTINLSTLRIWCYLCETEVFPGSNKPFFMIPENSASMLSAKKKNSYSMLKKSVSNSTNSSPTRGNSSCGEDSESDMEDDNVKPRGLTGLQNLGNTCYLNSALQALSNCPPLSRFFLDCHGFVQTEKNPKLARSYQRLISEIWHKRRPSYVIPNSVVNGIKVVHPMFRGYSQQDAQEFLRCFMDELHEELKQPVPCDSDENEDDSDERNDEESHTFVVSHDRQLSMDSNSSSSQSEEFYETCDSGLSSERCSAEVNMTGEEGESNDTHNTDDIVRSSMSDSSSRTRDGKTYAKLCQNDDKSNSVVASKHLKETANKMSKLSGSSGTTNSTNNTEDSGRVEDISSDGENTQQRLCSISKSSPRLKRATENFETSHTKKRNSSYSTKSNIQKQSKKKSVQYQSVISDVFDGKILSSVQCLTCERVSTTKETFQDLSLPIPGKDHLNMIHHSSQGSPPKGGACGEVHQGWISFMFSWMKSWFVGPTITLQDCLAAFFSADELKGDNMYSCEKCKKLRNGIKYSKVLELPEILCIHLKRFRHEFYSSKISSYVAFPLDGLDMKPYIHKDCKSDMMIYDLTAVICHHGTAGAGHYTAYCLNYTNEQWYEFDDQYVTEVDISQVMNCEAYVLFYRKRNDKMISVRQKAMQIKETQRLKEASLLQFFISKQWINRFNMFAEPGPITNGDFLCPHGGVPPHKVSNVDDLVEPFDQSLWEFLHGRFGGGPVCNHLYPCVTCQTDLDDLMLRQKTELEEFVELNDKFKDEDNPHIIYAISMTWFKEWENFVRKRSSEPPGPIDNKAITVTKNGQQMVRHNSDYGQLSEEMWQFLHGIYRGGPEVILKQLSSSPTSAISPSPSVSSLNSPKSTDNQGQTTPTSPQQPTRVQAKQVNTIAESSQDKEDVNTTSRTLENCKNNCVDETEIQCDKGAEDLESRSQGSESDNPTFNEAKSKSLTECETTSSNSQSPGKETS